MKGIFFVQLHNFICNKFNPLTWAQLLSQAGIPEGQLYFSHQQYPEDEFFKLLEQAFYVTKTPRERLLNEIGESMSPFFFQTFKSVLDKNWKTLDLIERMEVFNYNILQQGDNPSHIGKFIGQRVEPNKVEVKYTSPRKLCFLAMGIMKGFANHYNEKIIIKQTQCVFDDALECKFQVTVPKQLEL